MFKQSILNPAILLMNRLPFKLKIFTAISVLFFLLILPSKNIFTTYFKEYELYKNQNIGLNYTIRIQSFIKQIQLHRGLLNGYLNGNKNFKKDILSTEQKINTTLTSILEFDKKNLKTLQHNKNFVNAISDILMIRLQNLSQKNTNKEIFQIHSKIVTALIETIKDISKTTSFATSKDLKRNYIAHLLQDEILLLMEYSGQIRGVSVGILSKKEITKEQKSQVLSSYTLLKSLEISLTENKILSDLENYIDIQQQTVKVIQKLDEILYIVYNNIILSSDINYDAKLFFKQATSAIEQQDKLYNKLSSVYLSLLNKAQNEIHKNFTLSLAWFLTVALLAIYLATAFYHSITLSLKKLQLASQMIAEGKTDIKLQADTKDELGQALLAFNDMSKKLRENIFFLDGYKMAIDETSIVSKTNKRGIITYVNKKFCEISGYSEKELVGMSHNIVRHPDVPKSVFKELWKTIKSKQIWHGIIPNRAKDGSTYIVDATIIPVLDNKGEIIEFIGVRHDVTELEKSKEELRKNRIDILTGLPNRTQLLSDLTNSQKPVLLYLNIDDFNSLNDFYGNKMGDKVLIFVASILRQIALQNHAKAYKLQSDEFVLLFDNNKITKENCHDIKISIIQKIESLSLKCNSNQCIAITLSGGIAFYTSAANYENLLPYAALARKIAKSKNKKYLIYHRDLSKDSDYKQNMEWITKIKSAIDNNRIKVYYQPIIDNKTSTITKYEALVRLIDQSNKVVSPFFFLDIAKKAKLYPQITKIVIDQAFATFYNQKQYEFSVNLTIEDIKDPNTTNYIYDKLSKFPNSNNVIFEITEAERIDDYKLVDVFIKNVKKYKAKIAIDDFGSGYANFEHIISMDADFIKIDGSLIKNINTDLNSRYIAESIIEFSKKIGKKTVVEFVHSKEIYDIVKEIGADFSQGFYLGEPSPQIKSVKEIITSKEL